MSNRVVSGLAAVQIVAGRPDPTEPIGVGTIARALGLSLSSASRLLAELEGVGFVERYGVYGAYRIGPAAVKLSGRAAAPFTRSVRYAMTLAAQLTGETVCLAARSAEGMRIVASVESLWTLHAPAEVGTLVDDPASAIVRTATGRGGGADDAGDARLLESTIGMSVEFATPVFGPDGDCVTVLAVRLPTNRYGQNAQRARHAIDTARRSIESVLVDYQGARNADAPSPPAEAGPPSALHAALLILWHLAAGPDSIAGTARATGLRANRTQRLLESCREAGLVMGNRSRYQLGWIVHGWHRAAFAPTLVEQAKPLVADTANRTITCGFITVLKGMRSFTLVEELEMAGEGLEMAPWIGRPHPMIGSDGGPTLVMELSAEELTELFPSRHTKHELAQFLSRVRQVVANGVLTMQAFEDAGIVSISAPIRDASGHVAAAACIVGTTDYMEANAARFEDAARELAADVSVVLGYERS